MQIDVDCKNVTQIVYLQVDLPAIAAKFQERHGRSLQQAVESETSGDYRKALLKLLNKK
jgi:hypothetical protein